jgi:hypothetical protein
MYDDTLVILNYIVAHKLILLLSSNADIPFEHSCLNPYPCDTHDPLYLSQQSNVDISHTPPYMHTTPCTVSQELHQRRG